jgi:hypothetical protein
LDALVRFPQVVGVGKRESRRAGFIVGRKMNRIVVRNSWNGGRLVVETLDLALAEKV